jgi:hypothetical protein
LPRWLGIENFAVTALAKASFARLGQSADGFGLENFAMTALAKAGFARWSQSGWVWAGKLRYDRVGEGGLCPLEPERMGLGWKTSL